MGPADQFLSVGWRLVGECALSCAWRRWLECIRPRLPLVLLLLRLLLVVLLALLVLSLLVLLLRL
jgi:hypothetical protein